jgi:3-oxoacyl-[acyl-carrier-protein] synthase-1
MRPLSISWAGMMTGVGLQWEASAAALRAGIDGFAETGFVDEAGEPVIGSAVSGNEDLRGSEKLLAMLSSAVDECLAAALGAGSEQIPLIVCVAEKDRPGRPEDLDEEALEWIRSGLKRTFHPESGVVARGRVSIAHALRRAERLVYESRVPYCIVAGTDGFLRGPTLSSYESAHRLKTPENSNGFIPGEGAAAVLVGPPKAGPRLDCLGIGSGTEKATIESEEPLRADGLLQALREALKDSASTFDDVHYRITDLNGEQYAFKEASLAIARGVRKVKAEFELWHPAEGVGELGAAAGPCLLGIALAAARKRYSPGPGVLCHLGVDDGERAALVLRWTPGGKA